MDDSAAIDVSDIVAIRVYIINKRYTNIKTRRLIMSEVIINNKNVEPLVVGVDVPIDEWLLNEWVVSASELSKYQALCALHCEESYEGTAWLLLLGKSDGQLYEVYGTHGSFMGFEGQFDTERTSVEYLNSKHFKTRLSILCNDTRTKVDEVLYEKFRSYLNTIVVGAKILKCGE